MLESSLPPIHSRTISTVLPAVAGLAAALALAVFDPQGQGTLHGIVFGRWGVFGNLIVLLALAGTGFSVAALWTRRQMGLWALTGAGTVAALSLLTLAEELHWTGIQDFFAWSFFTRLSDKPKLDDVELVIIPRAMAIVAVIYGLYGLWEYRGPVREYLRRWRERPLFCGAVSYVVLICCAFTVHAVAIGGARLGAIEKPLALAAALALLLMAVILQSLPAPKPAKKEKPVTAQEKTKMKMTDGLKNLMRKNEKLKKLVCFLTQED